MPGTGAIDERLQPPNCARSVAFVECRIRCEQRCRRTIHWIDRRIAGHLVINRQRAGDVAGPCLDCRLLETREHGVACTRLLRDGGESIDGVFVLAITDEVKSHREARSLRGAALFAVLPPTDTDRGGDNDKHSRDNHPPAMTRPQLREVLLTEFLVNFPEDVAQNPAPTREKMPGTITP